MRGIDDQAVKKRLKKATPSALIARPKRGQFAAQRLNFFL
jgi:hypothetical protein